MRKFLLFLAITVVLVVAALAIVIATFDVDRFRPLLVSRLQGALARPVQLERISLGWEDGLAIRLHGLAIYEDEAQAEPLFRVESASALVRLRPLLRRRVEISSVVLKHPHLHVVRDARGRFNLTSLAVMSSPVAASGQTVMVGETPVSFTVDSLRIQQGVVRWGDATMSPSTDVVVSALDVTVQHISLDEPMDIDAQGTFGAEASNVHLRGQLRLPSSGRPGSIEQVTLTIERLPLERILPAPDPGEPRLRGTLTVVAEGRIETLEPTQLTRSMSGSAQLTLDEPLVVNLNVLRTVFTKLSMIPGLVERLEERLPPEYQRKLTAKDTVLSQINLSVRLEDGWLQFDDLHVSSDTFQLIGRGRVGLDGAVHIRSTLRIDRTLSAAILGGVHELRALTNAEGEMEFPVTIQGRAPRVAVLPDLNHIASKVVVTTAVDLLGSLLHQGEGEAEGPTEGDLLGGILRRVLDRHAPSE